MPPPADARAPCSPHGTPPCSLGTSPCAGSRCREHEMCRPLSGSQISSGPASTTDNTFIRIRLSQLGAFCDWKMCRKVFFFSLLLGFSPLGQLLDETGRGESYAFEDAIILGFEALRKLMKEGVPEHEIPPMEPLLVPHLHFDFYLRDTELRGYFRDAVVRSLSDFQIRNVTLDLSRRIEFSLEAFFERLDLDGDFSLEGILFGEFPVRGTGKFRVVPKGLTVFLSGLLGTKAGLLQLKDIRLDFQLARITVSYGDSFVDDEQRQIPEEFTMELLHRFRSRYLPLLLNTFKLIINDLIQRLDLWQDLNTLLMQRRHISGWNT